MLSSAYYTLKIQLLHARHKILLFFYRQGSIMPNFGRDERRFNDSLDSANEGEMPVFSGGRQISGSANDQGIPSMGPGTLVGVGVKAPGLSDNAVTTPGAAEDHQRPGNLQAVDTVLPGAVEEDTSPGTKIRVIFYFYPFY